MSRRPQVPSLLAIAFAAASFAPQAVCQDVVAEVTATNGLPSKAFTGRAERRAAYKNIKVLAAVDRGIGWLKTHQDEDGHWSSQSFMKHDPKSDRSSAKGKSGYDVGLTAMTLMALLAQGNSVHYDNCHRAADWLAKQFQPGGRIMLPTHDFIYSQALATAALVEASVMLKNPRHLAVAKTGLSYLETHRNTGAGWRYQPHDGQSDTSVVSWCMSAYFAGTSAGLKLQAKTIGEVVAWLDSVTNPADGHAGYTKRHEGSSRMPGSHSNDFPIERTDALTASALHARFMTGLSPRSDIAIKTATRLINRLPEWREGSIDFYYWLQGSIAMEQMHGSPQHKKWRDSLHKALLPHQSKRGSSSGSWDPDGAWCSIGGRVYATTMSVLALSSDYRFGSTHAMAQIPITAAFVRIRGSWRKGRIGEAATFLRKMASDELTPQEQATKQRLQWFISVEEIKANNVLKSLDTLYPSYAPRIAKLKAMKTTYAGLPVGEVVAADLKKLMSNPHVRDELAADKLLTKLMKDVNKALSSSKKSRRRKARDKLHKLIAKYPGTEAAIRADKLALKLQ